MRSGSAVAALVGFPAHFTRKPQGRETADATSWPNHFPRQHVNCHAPSTRPTATMDDLYDEYMRPLPSLDAH